MPIDWNAMGTSVRDWYNGLEGKDKFAIPTYTINYFANPEMAIGYGLLNIADKVSNHRFDNLFLNTLRLSGSGYTALKVVAGLADNGANDVGPGWGYLLATGMLSANLLWEAYSSADNRSRNLGDDVADISDTATTGINMANNLISRLRTPRTP